LQGDGDRELAIELAGGEDYLNGAIVGERLCPDCRLLLGHCQTDALRTLPGRIEGQQQAAGVCAACGERASISGEHIVSVECEGEGEGCVQVLAETEFLGGRRGGGCLGNYCLLASDYQVAIHRQGQRNLAGLERLQLRSVRGNDRED